MLLLIAPWLLIAPIPGEDLSPGERWLLVALCGVPIVTLLVEVGRNVVFVSQRGLWIGSRGWTTWDAVVSVRIEETHWRILPIEAPVLQLDVPVHQRGPGSREQLNGLGGCRLTGGNKRVWRQSNLICRWAELPPLPPEHDVPLPPASPRRTRPR